MALFYTSLRQLLMVLWEIKILTKFEFNIFGYTTWFLLC